ncbi:MAG: hypothetical protein Q8S57_11250 [Methanoregula sp.]|nr:hypothetical protein [Methanoregula sp.]
MAVKVSSAFSEGRTSGKLTADGFPPKVAGRPAVLPILPFSVRRLAGILPRTT